MTATRTILAILGTAALAGCATGHAVNDARQTKATGSAFTQELAGGYRELATYEADEMSDWRDANIYANRSLTAAGGESFPPVEPGTTNVESKHLPVLRQARSNLMQQFDKGAREQEPVLAARAQTQYDCWVEQQEEGHQPDHIAQCRDGFEVALDKLRARMEPDQEMAAAEPQTFKVFFVHDSADVVSSQVEQLHDAAEYAHDNPDMNVTVVGHTDTSGTSAYNRDLAIKRADTVKNLMVSFGVDGDRIVARALGETENAMDTGTNSRNRANRRVIVTVN